MNDIKKLTDYSHIRKRINMYLGGTERHQQEVIEYDENFTPVINTVTWVPALFTGFREIIDNAIDEVIAHGYGSEIRVNYSELDSIFSVEDNGRGIPIDYSEEYGIHLATMVLSQPRTGRNFDSRDKGQVGQNGIGSSATSNTSEWFSFKIKKDDTIFEQKFEESSGDQLTIHEPRITKKSTPITGTKVEYSPSKRTPKTLILPENFVKSRVIEIAANNPKCSFYFNNTKIKVKDSFEKTIFSKTSHISIDIEEPVRSFSSKFILVPEFVADGDFYYSVVNNLPAFNGGTHMEAFRLSFVRNLLNALSKENKKRKLTPNRSDVTDGLMVFNITNMLSPNFDAQSKTRLVNEEAGNIVKQFLDNGDFYDRIIKKNREWIDSIYKRCEARTHKKDASELEKIQKKNLRTKVPTLMDATGKDRSKCILILAEGNSAIGMASAVRDPEIHGGMPLRGKVLNVNGEKPTDVAQNKVIQDIMNAVGLTLGKKANVADLRYGQIWIATDADEDGKNIAALLINFFYTFWPELFDNSNQSYFNIFMTPFVIAEKGKERKYWYAKNYNEFNPEDYKGWTITRAKGLGTLQEVDWKHSIDYPELEPIVDDSEMKESLDMIFNNTRSNDRKDWMGI